VADLFLDTFNYNAGATASNALWAGLPVLTKMGEGYAARMAGSLLNAIDLPELITTTEDAYENLALDLATNPQKLQAIKEKLLANRDTKPLFDTALFTQHLEEAYRKIYDLYYEGAKPEHIVISDGAR
jgi:predicted O-linked N-acetylglucosamine transferase (SPINDLY family)